MTLTTFTPTEQAALPAALMAMLTECDAPDAGAASDAGELPPTGLKTCAEHYSEFLRLEALSPSFPGIPFLNPATGDSPMDEQDIAYALAKQVPDMASRGFIIGTSYGDLNIPPGPMADRIARQVTIALQVELITVARHSAQVAS